MSRRTSPERPTRSSRLMSRRLVVVLICVDVAIVLMVGAAWLALRDDRAASNVVNGSLRGSTPPAGQQMPRLWELSGMDPDIRRDELTVGEAVAVVATCLDCRSGDVIGGFLARIEPGEVPEGARIVVVGWDGDADAWRARWGIDDDLPVHVAADAATERRLRSMLADVGESGRVFVYDTGRVWRSTFHFGQLDEDDLLHDLGAVS